MPETAAANVPPLVDLPAIGSAAPDFQLPTHAGRQIRLSGLKGRKVVLYFYPKDDTPGCTLEAQAFRDLQEPFADANAIVLGISKDDVKSHDTFKAKHGLPFDLISDDAGTCEAYGAWVMKSMYGRSYMGIQRMTLLIDEQGTVARVWPKVSVPGHAAEVLKAAQAL